MQWVWECCCEVLSRVLFNTAFQFLYGVRTLFFRSVFVLLEHFYIYCKPPSKQATITYYQWGPTTLDGETLSTSSPFSVVNSFPTYN